MKLYDVKLRLSGSLLHTVWERHCTPAQIQLLARIHAGGSNDPIEQVLEVGSVKRSDQQERARLRLLYLEWNLGRGDELIKDVLGGPHVPLPQTFVPPQVVAVEDEFDLEAPVNLEDEEIEKLERPVEVMSAPEAKAPPRRFPMKGPDGKFLKEEKPTMSPPQQRPEVRA